MKESIATFHNHDFQIRRGGGEEERGVGVERVLGRGEGREGKGLSWRILRMMMSWVYNLSPEVQ